MKDTFLDSVSVHNPYTGIYCGQGHRRCLFAEMKKFTGQPREKIKPIIKPKQDKCFFCAGPLLVANYKDSVKDHDHITGLYRGAAHNECNFKLRLDPKWCRYL